MPVALSAPVDALPPGAVIGERYKLLKALGQGGFGITYIAWDNELARNVAVKECFPAALCRRDPMSGSVVPLSAAAESAYLTALDDMHKEAKTLAQVEHARVLRVHDVIWGNGSVFLIMPWLGGGSLAERMADTAHLPTEEQQLAWLADIVEGLAYLHGKGITHRDIKPSNILFDDAGRPVIIDLGAALNRNPADLTRSTTTRGAFSPGYASPEQATGKGKIGPWTDFYSLAATWYELLTGTRPEDAEKRLMEDDMVPLSAATLRIPCPREVVALLQRNLSLRPAERCASAADWQTVLRGGALPPLPRRRLPMVLAGVGALIVGGLGAFWGTVLHQQSVSVQAPSLRTPEEKQEEVDASAAALKQKLVRLYKVDDCLADLQQVQAKVEAIGDRVYEKEVANCDSWLKEMDTRQFRDKHAFAQPYPEEEDTQEIWPRRGCILSTLSISRYGEQAAESNSEFLNACGKLKEDTHLKYAQQGLGTGELSRLYHPADMQEAAVLPMVAAQIDKEVQDALASFDARVDGLSYISDYSEQSRRKAIQKWNDMAAKDAASRPRELEALTGKIREAAHVDDYLKHRVSFRARYEALQTQARQEEESLARTYRARINALNNGEEASALSREIDDLRHEKRSAYERELKLIVEECREADAAFDAAFHRLEVPTTPREQRLLGEATDAVRESVPKCDCYSWTITEFDSLREVESEIPPLF